MGLVTTFSGLERALEKWERDDRRIRSITVTDSDEPTADATADIEVSIPLDANGTDGISCDPTTGPDGTLELDVGTDFGVALDDDTVTDVEPVDATFDSDGSVRVTFSATLSVAGSGNRPVESGELDRDSSNGTHPTDGGSDHGGGSDKPPFRDPDLLEDVYESHDTFAEMAESLEIDVTGETVRRYMIDYDIHQPDTYDRSAGSEPDASAAIAGNDGSEPDASAAIAGNDGSEPDANAASADDTEDVVVLPDGIGLPENVTVEELTETVNDSKTIYEVKERLGMDRNEAHEMLKQLDLVTVVMGRLSNEPPEEVSRDDVVQRLREV